MAISIDRQLCQQLQQLDKYDQQTLDKLCFSIFECLNSNSINLDYFDEDTKALLKDSMTLVMQALKFGLSDSELNDLLGSVQCNSYYQGQLVQLYQRYKPGLSKILLAYSANRSQNRYVQVQWKLEVKVASKYIREQLVPIVVLRFQTNDHQDTPTYFDMQCSVSDIFHLVEKLGYALRRNNSQHSVKLLRHIK